MQTRLGAAIALYRLRLVMAVIGNSVTARICAQDVNIRERRFQTSPCRESPRVYAARLSGKDPGRITGKPEEGRNDCSAEQIVMRAWKTGAPGAQRALLLNQRPIQGAAGYRVR